MFDLKKLIVLFVVSILCMGGAVHAASGSDGKGSEKHSSSDNKKSSSDKDHESSDDKDHESTGENKKAFYDDKHDSWSGGSHLSLKDDDDYTPSSGDNKDSWGGKVFGGHDFNPGLGQGGDHWNDFSTSSVPEPETYAILIAGLSLLGFLSRRKKKDI